MSGDQNFGSQPYGDGGHDDLQNKRGGGEGPESDGAGSSVFQNASHDSSCYTCATVVVVESELATVGYYGISLSMWWVKQVTCRRMQRRPQSRLPSGGKAGG